MRNKRNPLVLGVLLGLLALAPALAAKSSLNSPDRKFVWTAAGGGMAEVQLGQLAVQKASNPDVKSFGQRMVDDHSKANDQLKSLAGQKGAPLPNGLPSAEKKELDKLSKLSGTAFDRAYMSTMVKDHKKDVGEFAKESKQAKDSDVKSFARSTLPTLRDHLKMAEDTYSKLHHGSHHVMSKKGK